jgi:starvation-inducible DNA-binding protein
MTFPAIARHTLGNDQPELSSKGDVIDFYGSCDSGLVQSLLLATSKHHKVARNNLPKETKAMRKNDATQLKRQETDSFDTPTDLSHDAVAEISSGLRQLLADVFALYIKTKNFHWHMSGRHFRDYHLLLDEHASQIFAMTDDIAERARKIGGTALHSISDITRHQRLKDNNAEVVSPKDMLAELCADNQQLTRSLRSTHEVCERHNDVATASLIETWIDETERRTWFLSEIMRDL